MNYLLYIAAIALFRSPLSILLLFPLSTCVNIIFSRASHWRCWQRAFEWEPSEKHHQAKHTAWLHSRPRWTRSEPSATPPECSPWRERDGTQLASAGAAHAYSESRRCWTSWCPKTVSRPIKPTNLALQQLFSAFHSAAGPHQQHGGSCWRGRWLL